MTSAGNPRTYGLVALIVFQTLCAVFFLVDVTGDFAEFVAGQDSELHIGIEFMATLGLFAGVVVESFILMAMLRRAARTEKAMDIARGALNEVIEGYFRDWGLTPSEEDVAAFTLKGCSISDIARFRGSAEGTIKTHLNAIYRKAGVDGRSQLVSLLLEDLMGNPLVGEGAGQAVAREPESRAG